ncbi:MAG: hypothetical protein U0872_01590 [Planctomycetaceae bacterium]
MEACFHAAAEWQAVLSIDGKTLRGSARRPRAHLLLVAHDCAGSSPRNEDEKTNEHKEPSRC